jgi:hypothetical protein
MRQIGAFRRAMVTLEEYYKELTFSNANRQSNPSLPNLLYPCFLFRTETLQVYLIHA